MLVLGAQVLVNVLSSAVSIDVHSEYIRTTEVLTTNLMKIIAISEVGSIMCCLFVSRFGSSVLAQSKLSTC